MDCNSVIQVFGDWKVVVCNMVVNWIYCLFVSDTNWKYAVCSVVALFLHIKRGGSMFFTVFLCVFGPLARDWRDIVAMVSISWMRLTQERGAWHKQREAYSQQWMKVRALIIMLYYFVFNREAKKEIQKTFEQLLTG